MINLLSSTLQRIGTQLITADDPSSVVIEAVDLEYLRHVLGRYFFTSDDVPFLCVMYTHTTCAEALGLPPAPLPAHVYLTWAYGKKAYTMKDAARTYGRKRTFDVVGYNRPLLNVPENDYRRNIYFSVIAPNEAFIEEVRLIDEGGDVVSMREENLVVRFPNEPPLGEADDDTKTEGADNEDNDAEPPSIDPDDCHVQVFCDQDDDFRESEYRQFMPIIDSMSIDELEEIDKLVDELWWGPLGTKEGRTMVRNHPLLRFTYHNQCIVTSRLYDLQNLIIHETMFRESEEYEFHPDASPEAEPYTYFGCGTIFDMHKLSYEYFDGLPTVDVQDYLTVHQRLVDAHQSASELLTRQERSRFDTVLGVLELTEENCVVLCSALFHSIHGPIVDGVVQPPTARMILADVFQESDLRSHLKRVWGLTLNGILARATPTVPVPTSDSCEHDPLDDHYVVSDACLQSIDAYENTRQNRVRPMPVKYRTVCDYQIGYDATLREPVRISMPNELLTHHEWQRLMSALNAYEPEELLPVLEELQQVWRIYRMTGHLSDDLRKHPIYAFANVDGVTQPFRLYVLMQTIKFNFHRRSYNRWYFYRPDIEFLT